MNTLYQRPAELLQHLIRFDTTNPPGNEAPCIAWVADLLRASGIDDITIVGKVPERTNLIARLKGRGDAPPLMLYGHVDVVPTAGQVWQRPPFSGDLIDGYVWGRGALDMKGPDAMMIAAFMRAKAENIDLPGDVLLVLVSDEEDVAEFGADYLVTEHPHLLAGVKYALGEFGAFSSYVGGKCFYPIMLAEKRVCQTRLTIHGPGGHGSMRHGDTAMSRLSKVLARLEPRLPVRITPVAQSMIEAFAAALDEPASSALRALLDPAHTDDVLDEMGQIGRMLDSILHNGANPTMINGGSRINVIPSEITLDVDVRLVPGVSDDEWISELRAALGGDLTDSIDITIVKSGEVSPDADLALYPMLSDVLREADPDGIPTPYIVSGATDGRIFAKLGIQTYGFTPMKLPADFNFSATVHAADERIPVDALEFGANAIFMALQRFG